MVYGQEYQEYVYESNEDGNMIQLYKYKVVDDNNEKLNEINYRASKSGKRKLGIDRDSVRAI